MKYFIHLIKCLNFVFVLQVCKSACSYYLIFRSFSQIWRHTVWMRFEWIHYALHTNHFLSKALKSWIHNFVNFFVCVIKNVYFNILSPFTIFMHWIMKNKNILTKLKWCDAQFMLHLCEFNYFWITFAC